MDALLYVPLIVGLVIWFWFAITMNGIHSELKKLNIKASSQIDFLDYISDQIASEGSSKERSNGE
jgi:hypothetical protein